MGGLTFFRKKTKRPRGCLFSSVDLRKQNGNCPHPHHLNFLSFSNRPGPTAFWRVEFLGRCMAVLFALSLYVAMPGTATWRFWGRSYQRGMPRWLPCVMWDLHSFFCSNFKCSYFLRLMSVLCILYRNFDYLIVHYAVVRMLDVLRLFVKVNFSHGLLLCSFATWTSLTRNSSLWTLNWTWRLSFFLVFTFWTQWYNQFFHVSSPAKIEFLSFH